MHGLSECAFVPEAGSPKDGTWCDQRFYTGRLVVEAGYGLSASD
jgi:hypothetical protein